MAEVIDILSLIPQSLNLRSNHLWLDYDDEADVLYMCSRQRVTSLPFSKVQSLCRLSQPYHYLWLTRAGLKTLNRDFALRTSQFRTSTTMVSETPSIRFSGDFASVASRPGSAALCGAIETACDLQKGVLMFRHSFAVVCQNEDPNWPSAIHKHDACQ